MNCSQFGCLLYVVEVEDLRYPFGAVGPGAPDAAAIPIQKNGLHYHIAAARLKSDGAAHSDFLAH